MIFNSRDLVVYDSHAHVTEVIDFPLLVHKCQIEPICSLRSSHRSSLLFLLTVKLLVLLIIHGRVYLHIEIAKFDCLARFSFILTSGEIVRLSTH